jgi:hypothetical protein
MSADDYGHEELLPTVEFVSQDLERWKDMVRRLQERILAAEGLISERGHWMPDTADETACETAEGWKEKVRRSLEESEWVYERHDGDRDRTIIGDVRCMFRESEECWFVDNRDRLGEYGGSHVLRGTDGKVAMCDVCSENHGIDDEEVESYIKRHFRTAEEEAEELQVMERQIRPKIAVGMADVSNWEPGVPAGNVTAWRCGMGRSCVNEERRDRVGYHHQPTGGSGVRVCICERCWRSSMYASGALIERTVTAVAKEMIE